MRAIENRKIETRNLTAWSPPEGAGGFLGPHQVKPHAEVTHARFHVKAVHTASPEASWTQLHTEFVGH